MAGQLTLSTRSLTGLAANFRARDQRFQARAREIVRDRGQMLWEDAFLATPKDTWFMATHLRLIFSEGGLTFEAGWLAEDFAAAGLAFYPLYVIFGTRFMPGRDFFFPLRDYHYGLLRQELRAELRASIARGQ